MENMVINSHQNNKAESAINTIPLLITMLPIGNVNTMTISTLPEKTIVSQVPEITKDLLAELYLEKKMSVSSLAKFFQKSEKTILRNAKKFGFKRGQIQRSTRVDLTGRIFERLTVINEASNKQNTRFWNCQCSCGKTVVCQQSNLFSGNSKSCGCLATALAKERYTHDLTGKKFGRLTVLSREKNASYGSRKWRCLCDCGKEIIVYGGNLAKGHTQSCGCLQKDACSGESNHHYVGGDQFYNYKPAKSSLGYAEETRRDSKNINAVQVRCTYCNQWFSPTKTQVHGRRMALEHYRGESRFYCSDNCKKACPTFNQKKYPKGFKKASSREVNPILRHIVLERDKYECQKCGATISDNPLHVHHVKSFTLNRILGDDPDNCITLCKECHKIIHQQDECKYTDLKCNK